MLAMLMDKDRGASMKGINNVVMQCRKVCNDPLLSKLHVPAADACLKDMCVPATVQLGGKLAVLLQLIQRLHSLGVRLQHLVMYRKVLGKISIGGILAVPILSFEVVTCHAPGARSVCCACRTPS